MHKLIDFYKDCLTKYEGWKCYEFKNLKPTTEYKENIGEFYNDVGKDGYKIGFQEISNKYIEEKNNNGELYLFEIYNQDFAEGKTGKKNLHTMYFETLFSQQNKENNFPFKLNGQAELFFRPKAIEEKKVKRNFKREIIEKKRYTKDKVFFHCPINMNRGKGDIYQFNNKINQFLVNNPDINIIGIDRGEKHLAYYSVINQKQKILDSGTLNTVNKVDYHQKLEEKAKNREEERQTWNTVESIKDLKKGYISQVVRKLADLAIEHNAIIVFEDLNMRFKQIRGGIEKSVYQQLEKALIEKLNFLVNKGEKNPEQAGHLLRAYQLAAPFTTFKEMGKQTGIIFYTQASYTSRIDPVTGWRPNLYLKYKNAKQSQKEILQFDKIEFNQSKNRFEFSYNLSEFIKDKKKAKLPKKTKWTVCSNVDRFYWNRHLANNKGNYEFFPKEGENSITERLKKLFNDFGIDIRNNVLEQIERLEPKGNEKFFKDLLFYFRLICQIRNTHKEKEGDDNDFIFSPVEPFFDSRENNDDHLPKNGDDNGAYNIARKGIIILNKISDFAKKNGNVEKMKWNDLYISNQDWDDFIQE